MISMIHGTKHTLGDTAIVNFCILNSAPLSSIRALTQVDLMASRVSSVALCALVYQRDHASRSCLATAQRAAEEARPAFMRCFE